MTFATAASLRLATSGLRFIRDYERSIHGMVMQTEVN